MKILITGGAGFIGSYLTDRLIVLGHKVAILDNRLNFTNNPKYYKSMLDLRKKMFSARPLMDFDIDIRHRTELSSAVQKFKPEIIVHLAAISMARVPANHVNIMEPINMQGTLNVLHVFEESPYPRRLVYTSSSMTYGHFTQNPQPEFAMLHPINSYGACKAAGEYFIKLSQKEWVIVRPTSVYGFTDCANRVTQILFDAAVQGTPAWVVKGESLDFSYIDDVVDGFVRAITMDEANHDTFNISRGQSRTAEEFAFEVQKYFPSLKFDIREPTHQQVFRGALDITKARKKLKFAPKVTMEAGIKKTIQLMQSFGQISHM